MFRCGIPFPVYLLTKIYLYLIVKICKFYNIHLLLTVPRTNDSVFNLPEGTFTFPSSEELFFPFHNGIWTINVTNNDTIRLHISYSVEYCTDCNCDKIEVSSPNHVHLYCNSVASVFNFYSVD